MNYADEGELACGAGGPGKLPFNGFSGLEAALIEIAKYVSGFEAREKDSKYRFRTWRNATRLLLWIGSYSTAQEED